MTENEVAKQIVDVAFKTHTTFEPGLLESVYETIMAYKKLGILINFNVELIKNGISRVVNGL